ncbi:MAG TPA: hypothetical protein VK498_14045 [Ferruginibacter sp.]|nr:hypothetical protein [Ferruginibacter sp.]
MYKYLAFIILIISCNNNTAKPPETALDTGREFIEASLKGDFENAQKLLLNDSENLQLFDSYKHFYDRLPGEKKQHYKNAQYNINKYLDVNDSVTIINYSNDYMNKPMDIKVVRLNKKWSIDFKYTYSGNLPID